MKMTNDLEEKILGQLPDDWKHCIPKFRANPIRRVHHEMEVTDQSVTTCNADYRKDCLCFDKSGNLLEIKIPRSYKGVGRGFGCTPLKITEGFVAVKEWPNMGGSYIVLYELQPEEK